MKKHALIYPLILCFTTTCTMEIKEKINPVNSLKKQCIQTILRFPHVNTNAQLLPHDVHDDIRHEFFKQSKLLRDIYAHTIEKKVFFCPYKCGSIVFYDKKLQKIVVNCIDNTTGQTCFYLSDLEGNIAKIYKGKHYYPPKFTRYLNSVIKEAIADVYTLALTKDATIVKPYTILEINNEKMYDRQINVYTLLKTEKVKNFFQKHIPIEQVFLLSSIEQTQNNKLQLKLTEKEQKIYSELLPEIKEAIEPHVCLL